MPDLTLKDIQVQLHGILMADHPLTGDQRVALKKMIEMCDLWQKLAPGFSKVLKDMQVTGELKSKV